LLSDPRRTGIPHPALDCAGARSVRAQACARRGDASSNAAVTLLRAPAGAGGVAAGAGAPGQAHAAASARLHAHRQAMRAGGTRPAALARPLFPLEPPPGQQNLPGWTLLTE